jgi:heme-degrading monooxygenase HmoA
MAFYTLSQTALDEGKEAVAQKLDASVKGMVGKVRGLLRAEVKLNLSESPHDLIFYSEFERMEDIPPYLKSTAHEAHAAMADRYVENRENADVEVCNP